MWLQKNSAAAIILSLGAVLGASSSADEFAQMPYRDLCAGMNIDFSGDAASLPREMEFTVKSTLPHLKPSDIRLTLKGGDESHEIAVSPAGSFKLPVSKSLFESDASLISNQPAGTLELSAAAGFGMAEVSVPVNAHVRDGQISYEELSKLAIEGRQRAIQKLEEQNGGAYSPAEPDPSDGTWFIILMASEDSDSAKAAIVPDPKQANVGAFRKAFQKLIPKQSPLMEVKPGVYLIRFSEALRDQNPKISLSKNPSWVCAINNLPKKAK